MKEYKIVYGMEAIEDPDIRAAVQAMTEEQQTQQTALTADLRAVKEKVNNTIASKRNDLQTRYNQLMEVEDRLKKSGLHNHYY